jgi:hypothetical protein
MSEKRATTSAGMHHAILRLAVDSASGRAEDSYLFHKKNSHREFFCEKEKITYHAAAGESGLHWVKRSRGVT